MSPDFPRNGSPFENPIAFQVGGFIFWYQEKDGDRYNRPAKIVRYTIMNQLTVNSYWGHIPAHIKEEWAKWPRGEKGYWGTLTQIFSWEGFVNDECWNYHER